MTSGVPSTIPVWVSLSEKSNWEVTCDHRPSRVPGAYVVTLDAKPVLYVERGGKGLVPLREADEDWLRPSLEALAEAVRRQRVPRLGIERFDAEPVVGSPTGELLVELGFRQSPRRLTLSA